MRFLIAHMLVVDQVKFSHHGRRLFGAGSNVPKLRNKPGNRGIYVWDLARGLEPVGCLLPDSVVAGFTVNPASGWLYVGTGYDHWDDEASSGYVAVHSTRGTVTQMGLIGGNSFTLAVHPSGQWLVVAGEGSRSSRRSNRRDQLLVRWQHSAKRGLTQDWKIALDRRRVTLIVAIDPDGSRIVTHDIETGRLVIERVYELQIRGPENGRIIQSVPIPSRTVQQLLYAPDGLWLVIRGGPSLLVWNARALDTEPPRKLRGAGRGNFTDIAFHPSGRYLAATSNDATVKLYDTTSWELAKTYTWDIGRMRSIAFSPDGTLAAAGSDTGKVVVWDVDL